MNETDPSNDGKDRGDVKKTWRESEVAPPSPPSSARRSPRIRRAPSATAAGATTSRTPPNIDPPAPPPRASPASRGWDASAPASPSRATRTSPRRAPPGPPTRRSGEGLAEGRAGMFRGDDGRGVVPLAAVVVVAGAGGGRPRVSVVQKLTLPVAPPPSPPSSPSSFSRLRLSSASFLPPRRPHRRYNAGIMLGACPKAQKMSE